MKTMLILMATALLVLGIVGLLIPSTNGHDVPPRMQWLMCVKCFKGSDAAKKGLGIDTKTLNCSDWPDNRVALEYSEPCDEKEEKKELEDIFPGPIKTILKKLKKTVKKAINDSDDGIGFELPWPFDDKDDDEKVNVKDALELTDTIENEIQKLLNSFIRLPKKRIIQGQCSHHTGTWNGEEVEWSRCKYDENANEFEEQKSLGAGCKEETSPFQGRDCLCGTHFCNTPTISISAMLVGPSFGTLVMGLLVGVGGALLPLLFQ